MSIKSDYQEMYDLGYEHGYNMALKEMELKKLKKELEELKNDL